MLGHPDFLNSFVVTSYRPTSQEWPLNTQGELV
jgi:hypothetical protein